MDFDSFENEKPKREPDEIVYDDDSYGAPMFDEDRPRRRGARWPLYVMLGCLLSCCACCALPLCGLTVAGISIAAILDNSELIESGSETITLESEDPITLTVNSRVGNVTVKRGASDSEVTVDYTKKAYGLSKGRAEKELKKITVNVDQPSAGRVDVTVELDRAEDSFFNLANQVDLTILVPEQLYLDITNNVGKVTITGVQTRSLSVTNTTGSISFDGMLGVSPSETYSMQTNTGAITVHLPKNTYLALDASTDIGSVTVADTFSAVDRQDASPTSDVNDRWQGILGSSSEDAPSLTLKVNVGEITVSPQ